MKSILRNLTLGAAALVAASAMAQTGEKPFTVTKNWEQVISGHGYADCRFGTGVNGKVYFTDKKNLKVYAVDGTGVKEYCDGTAGMSTIIGADDAGNLLISRGGWAGANSSKMFQIVPADGSDKIDIGLVYPDGIPTGRQDQLGRIVGDMMSEDGAFFYLLPSNSKIVTFKIANGAQDTEWNSFPYPEFTSKCGANTSTCVQPRYSFSEMVGLAADAVNGYYARNRSNPAIFYYDFDNLAETSIETDRAYYDNTEGFDVFKFGDNTYYIQPYTGDNGIANNGAFNIFDQDKNILYTDQSAITPTSKAAYASYNARQIADDAVELYQYYAGPGGLFARQYTIKKTSGVSNIAVDTDKTAPVYYDLRGIRVANPSNGLFIKVADGKASKVLVK